MGMAIENVSWGDIEASHQELWDKVETTAKGTMVVPEVLTPADFEEVVHSAMKSDALTSSLPDIRSNFNVAPMLLPSESGQFCCTTVAKWAIDLYNQGRLSGVYNPMLSTDFQLAHDNTPHAMVLYNQGNRRFFQRFARIDQLHYQGSEDKNPPHPSMRNARINLREWVKPGSEVFRRTYELDQAGQFKFFSDLINGMYPYFAYTANKHNLMLPASVQQKLDQQRAAESKFLTVGDFRRAQTAS
jgi:hypothetical protein